MSDNGSRPSTPTISEEEIRQAQIDGLIRDRRIRQFDDEVWPEFRGANIMEIEQEDRVRLRQWVCEDEPRNLVFTGPVGCGKTHAAVCVCRLAAGGGRRPLLTSMPMLMRQLRPGGDDGRLEEIVRAPILLLDDVGAEKVTEWTAEQVAIVIDERWRYHRPIIATTNLSVGPEGELVQAIGERSYSRLCRSGSMVVQFEGDDRRRVNR